MNQALPDTTVLIIEDHPLFATGLRELVNFVITDCHVLQAESLRDAGAVLSRHRPTLIIADLNLGDCGGLETAHRLVQMAIDLPILFISGDEALLNEVARLSLPRCFAMPKTGDFYQTAQMLTECISRASVITNWRAPVLHRQGRPSSLSRGRRDIGGRVHLTQKQTQVMQLLVNGLSNKEIARQLSLSPETVKTHLREIFTRMNVRNRTQAVSLFKKTPSLASLQEGSVSGLQSFDGDQDGLDD